MSGGVKNSKTPAGDEAASCCETFNLGTGLRVKNTGESHKANDHAHDQKAHNHNKCSDDHSHEGHNHDAHSHGGEGHSHDEHNHKGCNHDHAAQEHSHEGHDHGHEGDCCSAAPEQLSSLGGSQVVAGGLRTEIRIMQMDCPVEENLIKKKLGGMSSVKELDFNLMQRVLTVTHTPDSLEAIMAAIRSLGFEPEVSDNTSGKKNTQEKKKALVAISSGWRSCSCSRSDALG